MPLAASQDQSITNLMTSLLVSFEIRTHREKNFAEGNGRNRSNRNKDSNPSLVFNDYPPTSSGIGLP